MEEEGYQQKYSEQAFSDTTSVIRDVEEKQKLLKERLLLVGKSLIETREKSFLEMQEMKKLVSQLKSENEQIKSFLQRVAEKVDTSARKEDLMILQRQLDLLRKT